jgi:hypothetical protein
MEGAFAKNAVKGIVSSNPLKPRKSMLKGGKAKKETPAKPINVKSERVTKEEPTRVNSERVTKEEPQRTGPINVKSTRVYPPEERPAGPRALPAPQKALPAPPAKKASKPRKPRDVKYTQPTLPGMRNTRQFKSPNGKS